MKKFNWLALIFLLVDGVSPIVATAQTYPSKPIRFVAAYSAGGPSDIVTRAIGKRMSEVLGQPVIVENRAGAGGHIGAASVAHAAPDGYTLLLGGSYLTIGPSMYKHLSYDPDKDLVKIALIALNQYLMVVHPTVPVHSVKDLIKLAKSRPGELNYASSGLGAPPQLATALFSAMAKIKVVHIPYKGATPALTALISGEVDFYIGGISGALPHVKSNRLRALAVTGVRRSSELPEVPTMSEAGLPGYALNTWFGVVGPAGIPEVIVKRLNESVTAIVKETATAKYLVSLGLEPATSTPQEFDASFRRELPKFSSIVKSAGIKPQ